jgi:hypothetical protein
MDYTKLTIAEIANGISQTEAAIRRCREILDDAREQNCGYAGSARGDTQRVAEARRRLEGPDESLHQRYQAQAALIIDWMPPALSDPIVVVQTNGYSQHPRGKICGEHFCQLTGPSSSKASMIAQVCGPTTPSTVTWDRCCKSLTAASVLGP